MKLSIKARLIAGFSLLILLTAVIFYIGNNASGNMNNSLNRIVKVNTARVVYSTYIRGTVHILAGKARDLCLLKDQDLVQEAVNDIETKTNECRGFLTELNALADDRGLELIGAFEVKLSE